MTSTSYHYLWSETILMSSEVSIPASSHISVSTTSVSKVDKPRFKDKRVLLFDLDGTLVDSAPDLALAVNQTLAILGRSVFEENTIRGWVGNGAQVLIERALSAGVRISDDLDRDLATRALAVFLDQYQQCLCVNSCLYAGVKETLESLAQQDYRLAIVTNKPERFVAPILEGLGLNGLFELIIGGDTLVRRKPDPLPIEHACKVLGVQAKDCVMVGDSKNDILAAKAAMMASVGLTYGYNYGENIAVYEPEWVLDHFADLLSI
jgi:phosphoglycolate phosphatase